MKISKIIFFLIIFISCTFAQNTVKTSAFFDVNFVSGDFSSLLKTGTGFHLNGEYSFKENYSIVLLVGYGSYPSKIGKVGADSKTVEISMKSLLTQGGLRYYFNKNLFISLTVGGNFLKINGEIWNSINNTTNNESTDYEFFFSFRPSIGYRIFLAERSSFDIKGSFQSASKEGVTFSNYSASAGLSIFF